MDVAAHRTIGIRVLMKMEQLSVIDAFHRTVDIQKGNLIQRFGDGSASGASCHVDQSGSFQLGQQAADDNRVYVGAPCQELAGNFLVFGKCIDAGKDVDSQSKSA